MTPVATDLEDLHGAELIDALERRFTTSLSEVTAGSRTIELLHPKNSDDLIREEDFVKDERLPYWADVWPSSTILASYLFALSDKRTLSARKNGLELGCGLGLVTTAAMTAGYDMLASDYYTDALAFTRANAWRELKREPETMMIDWRAFPAAVAGFDLILASDVLYEREYAELLPGIFKGALAPGGVVLVADPGRIGVADFVEECRYSGLVIRSKTTYPFEAGEVKQKIDIYEIADERS
jgi:predicted nicotinamide N-methyase